MSHHVLDEIGESLSVRLLLHIIRILAEGQLSLHILVDLLGSVQLVFLLKVISFFSQTL